MIENKGMSHVTMSVCGHEMNLRLMINVQKLEVVTKNQTLNRSMYSLNPQNCCNWIKSDTFHEPYCPRPISNDKR